MPICYTFRRCPYAIRARMAIRSAQIDVEYREIIFRHKPPHMLDASPKGTVPVLILEDGSVIDESWDVMKWALGQNDPDKLLGKGDCVIHGADELIKINDGEFKHYLDRYKYANRYPENSAEEYRQKAVFFLEHLENRLKHSTHLVADQMTVADIGVFPFIRQFAMVDIDWFNLSSYLQIKAWLNELLDSNLFKSVMVKKSIWEFA